jgi:hypothetical protein
MTNSIPGNRSTEGVVWGFHSCELGFGDWIACVYGDANDMGGNLSIVSIVFKVAVLGSPSFRKRKDGNSKS